MHLSPPPQIGTYTGGGEKGSSVTLSTEGPSGLQANPLYYKTTEETQRFEQVQRGAGAGR